MSHSQLLNHRTSLSSRSLRKGDRGEDGEAAAEIPEAVKITGAAEVVVALKAAKAANPGEAKVGDEAGDLAIAQTHQIVVVTDIIDTVRNLGTARAQQRVHGSTSVLRAPHEGQADLDRIKILLTTLCFPE